MKPLTKISGFFDSILRLFTGLAGVVLVLLTIIIPIGTFMRYFFKRPIPGLIEISEYCLLWMTFLVAAWILKDDGHIKMDLVLNKLSPHARVILNIITSILGTITTLGLTWYSVNEVLDLYQSGFYQPMVVEIPKAYIMVVIPVGSFLIFIQFLRRTYAYFGQIKKPSVEAKKPVISGDEF